MTALKDMPLDTPWPGPEGGTLRTVSENAQYGNAGFTLKNAPLNTPWPPTYTQSPSTVKYGTLSIHYGGSTGSIDGESHLETCDYIDIGAFKMEDGGTLRDAIRAANPNCKILMYKAASDMGMAANTTQGIRAGEGGVSYLEAQAHDASNPGDPWILKDANGNPIVAYGYGEHYNGDIGSPTFQARWLSNVRAALTYYGLLPGKDGVFIDNVIGYMSQFSTKYPTDASWRVAMLSFCKNALLPLKQQGFYMLGNTIDNDDNMGNGIKQFWSEVAPYVNGMMQEGWMSTWADRTRMRKDSSSSWQDFYPQWVQIMNGAQNFGADAHVLQISTGKAGHENEAIYGRAAFLLNWNGGGGSFGWNVGGDQYSPVWRQDVGLPLAAQTSPSPSVFRRYYQKAAVILNSHISNNYTITSSPDGRAYTLYTGATATFPITLAPGQAIILMTTQTGGGGGGGGGNPAASKTSTFSDNFNDNVLDQQWTKINTGVGATATETGGAQVLAVPLNSGSYITLRLLASDLTESSCYVSLDPGSITNSNQEVNFIVWKDSLNSFGFFVIWNGTARVLRPFRHINGAYTTVGTITPYDPAGAHKFLRLRESLGTIFWETSPDGTTWTTRFSNAEDFVPNNVFVTLEAGQDSTTCPAISATFDNFNTLTSGISYDAEITAEGALVNRNYKLNEASGATVAVDAKNAVNSTAKGTGALFGGTALIVGDSGTSLDFDGTANAFLTLPAAGIAAGAKWAIEAWFRNEAQGTVGALDYSALFGNAFGARMLVRWAQLAGDAGPRLMAQFGGINLDSAPSYGVPHNVVHQVALEYDLTNLIMYIDGAERARAAVVTAPDWLNATWYLGSYDSFHENYMLDGKMEKVVVYNDVLGASKVSSHYINGTT